MPKIKDANGLTQYALKVLRLAGFICWRQNNGGVWDQKLQCYRANSSTPGISDIIGYHRDGGRFLACEIKVGRDRLSPEQDAFLLGVVKSGGTALTVRHADDLRHLLPER